MVDTLPKSANISACCAAAVVSLAMASACDSDDTSGAGLTGGATGSGAAAGFGFGGSGQGGDMGCLTANIEGERKPLVMLVVLDRSGSMSSKWSGVEAAFSEFFSVPSTAGISVGLNFFAPAGTADSCNLPDYNPPQHYVGKLPGHGSILNGVITGMSGFLGGQTPTSAALAGSLDWAVSYRQSHPDWTVVVVLTSDGDPTSCDTDIANIAALAATAFGEEVRTFVIAVDGATVANLDQIAAAGGTTAALDATSDIALLNQRLNQIREVTVSCNLVIPDPEPGQPFDPAEVNVRLDPDGSNGSQEPIQIPQVAGESECGNEAGWYYDDADMPTEVFLCPATCDLLRSPDATVRFVFGCPTLVK